MEQPLTLLPRPMRVERREKEEATFSLPSRVVILVEPGSVPARAAGELLAGYLGAGNRHETQVVEMKPPAPPAGSVRLFLDGSLANAGPEGYELEVAADGVSVRALEPAGLFNAVQTIRQVFLPADGTTLAVKLAKIEDRPRFSWRGYHLDCCRHFMDKELVKRMLDLLAYHKMNRFHWHLTEDQGWRIPIERYPRLAEVAAWRDDGKGGRYGGMYTREDIREVVAYAKARNIVVVPEIEMPGHSKAALAAYPELSCTGGPFKVGTEWGVYKDVYCAGNDKVFEFLEGVLAEVIDLFPGPYVHIGADECPKDRWKECPKCQARIKKEGLKDEFALQTWFVGRMGRWLQKHGKTVIAWDEILEGGAPPGTIVQSWRGHENGANAARAGSNVIVSPYSHMYFDYDPKWFGVQNAYRFDPVPPGLDASLHGRILGSECLLWTEGAPPETVDSKTFPRLCAAAEVFWSPLNDKDWPEFSSRLARHSERLRAMGVDLGPIGGEGD